MKILYLVRHAKSSWDDGSMKDFDRPLNKRGLRDAPFTGKLLAGMKEAPEIIVTSAALRALTTARLLAGAIGLPPEAVTETRSLYVASVETILGVINELDDDVSRAMIVGHNPGMAQLAFDLSSGAVDRMPTCSVAAFSFSDGSWREVRAGKGNLRFFEAPKKHTSDR